MRTRRSRQVVLGGMGALALTLTACSSEPDKRCVDRVTRDVLPDYKCGSSNGSGGSSGTYYYGGNVRNGKVEGGSFDKSAVQRGGFGKSGSGGG
ncbi:hypothetical protein BJP40_16965 [Streptomyces sp. CC53]|uniref:hypothetical protein n=1 Tax=unclassified Streptomyces TaxID=2593676 RepID=UPI0008DD7E0F|nr:MULTISPECIES: hypothetical protein [unclassified Streptomyces]OII65408.1 hypothetical protein BJP40_16965 [Streptomyces sp. CC53]